MKREGEAVQRTAVFFPQRPGRECPLSRDGSGSSLPVFPIPNLPLEFPIPSHVKEEGILPCV